MEDDFNPWEDQNFIYINQKLTIFTKYLNRNFDKKRTKFREQQNAVYLLLAGLIMIKCAAAGCCCCYRGQEEKSDESGGVEKE